MYTYICDVFPCYYDFSIIFKKKNCSVVLFSFFHFSTCIILYVMVNSTWQNPHHMLYHPEKPISSRGPLGPSDDIGRVLG